jgi:MFS transporter (putative signal transducer)
MLFALLYFNEGAPIGLIWLALPALLRSDGVPIERIGSLLFVVVLPWTLKFLAGPFVDSQARVRGGSRALLMATQAGMASTMLAASRYSDGNDLDWLLWVLVGHAFCAALQDVTIDALAIRLTTAHERGRLNAAMQLGLYAGRSLSAGMALGAITGLAWKEACIAMAILQGLTIVLAAFLELPAAAPGDAPLGPGVVKQAIVAALRRRQTWFALAFAGLAGAGYEATAGLAGPWLVDREVTTEAIGRWQSIGVPLMIVLGSQFGGLLADWRGHRWATGAGLVGFVAVILALAGKDRVSPESMGAASTWVALGAMYCAVGVFTVGSYALFMDLTDKRIGGSQFSAFMSATNGCEAWSLAVGASLAARVGYAGSVSLLCVVSLCCLTLLPLVGPAKPTFPALVDRLPTE